jgi:hypothetical protein
MNSGATLTAIQARMALATALQIARYCCILDPSALVLMSTKPCLGFLDSKHFDH